jgi:hypothetical protein
MNCFGESDSSGVGGRILPKGSLYDLDQVHIPGAYLHFIPLSRLSLKVSYERQTFRISPAFKLQRRVGELSFT